MNDLMCLKIAQLVEYGVSQGLCASSDALYVRHRLMALLRVDAWIAPVVGVTPPEFGGLRLLQHLQTLPDGVCRVLRLFCLASLLRRRRGLRDRPSKTRVDRFG